ncbi:MAG: RNA-binding protein [Candidatus Nomurabacteria bacterium]|nr:RNA-binding protein [Candidatus Nomurabacteria bacterium]
MKKIFVGSLSWDTRDEGLREFFAQFGEVASASVVMERDNPNRSRGFGFVEFENDADADRAIAEADGQELDGRKITVSESTGNGRRDSGNDRRQFGRRRDQDQDDSFARAA